MMKVLILGDEHISGCGLQAGQLSYVSHLVRQMSRAGQPVRVEAWICSTPAHTLATLARLPLSRYDLILVQASDAFSEVHPGWPVWLLRLPAALSAVLQLLRPYRHTVVFMTPMPHQNRVVQRRRNRLRAALLRRTIRQVFSVFDTSQVLAPRPEYFSDRDAQYLNASGHELLGRSLFAFYQSAPTIVTIQPIRRG